MLSRDIKNVLMKISADLMAEALGAAPAVAHPVDSYRDNARFELGRQQALAELGFSPGDEMSALANNDDYYNRLRALYDQYQSPKTEAASEQTTKVVSTPKS